MTAVLMSLATFFSTLGGGLFALRARRRLHDLLGFTGGVLLGVVAFDLLPEIFSQAQRIGAAPTGAMVALVAGFLFFHALEKFLRGRQRRGAGGADPHQPQIGVLSALALIGHSVLDGVGIGLAFQISPEVGAMVAAAVIAHDGCDGLNTMGLMLSHRNSKRLSLAMLLLDAAAPMAGVGIACLLTIPPAGMLLYLGFFAGFLLSIALSDVLPQAHSDDDAGTAPRLIGLTTIGAALVFVIVRCAG
ncbi:MAG: ZIP family metal transporter [Burkholderiales bacterium]|nr:ZIP family metal transporter [Burkholderiales bacterium]MDE2396894.1 ZIP family metal transporter [Burkholderiales bacterium]MDE2456054.1 ZIP family metal transporter [Burkholderiales bacterium]